LKAAPGLTWAYDAIGAKEAITAIMAKTKRTRKRRLLLEESAVFLPNADDQTLGSAVTNICTTSHSLEFVTGFLTEHATNVIGRRIASPA